MNNPGYKELWQDLKLYLLAIVISFGLTAVLIGIAGYNVPKALQTLILRPFSTRLGFIETLKKFIPLTLTTYAFAIPFRIKFFNIGAWGQMLVGGIGAAIAGLSLASLNLPALFLIPFLLLTAMLAGSLFASIAAVLKAYYNINPIISTIMLNFVGLYCVNFFATSTLWKAELSGHPMTRKLPETAFLPELIRGLHLGIVVLLLVIIVVYFFMNKTVWGYEISAIGYNPSAASTYGIPLKHTLIQAFMISFAISFF